MPDVFEIVEAFLAYEPFCSANSAFGKAAAGLGVVTQINSIGLGFEDDFVKSDDLAFAKRGDLERFKFGIGVVNDFLDRDRGSGGCVFLVGVMAFKDLSGIFVAKGGGSRAGDVKKEIHSNRKVRRVDETSFMALD